MGSMTNDQMQRLLTEIRETAQDTQRRIDQLAAILMEHGQRLSNIEQALIKMMPYLRVSA
jgi:hypothetical protein